MTDSRLALSVDLDEWYHSTRWLDGRQKHDVPDMPALFRSIYGTSTPAGDVVAPTRLLLDILDEQRCRCTFFVLGEVAEWYPELIRELAVRGHEVACHGLHHVDMTVLGPDRFAREVETATDILERITDTRPTGYRAPNLVYEPWATEILESLGYEYDSTVCVSRPVGGKYRGWSHAPLHPYHPSYDNIATRGDARLVEFLPCFPVLRISAGSGIFTRAIGYHWTNIALRSALRTGHTSYYLHPWELAARPLHGVRSLKSRLLYRRTGPWMLRTVRRLLRAFQGRIVPVGECARAVARDRRQSRHEEVPARPRLEYL